MLSMLLVALGMGMCHGRVPAVRFICKILFICNMYAIRSVHIRRHEQGQFTVAKTTARRHSSDPSCAGLQPQTTARRYSLKSDLAPSVRSPGVNYMDILI